jgi:hypothetical protein
LSAWSTLRREAGLTSIRRGTPTRRRPAVPRCEPVDASHRGSAGGIFPRAGILLAIGVVLWCINRAVKGPTADLDATRLAE